MTKTYTTIFQIWLKDKIDFNNTRIPPFLGQEDQPITMVSQLLKTT